jgi:hypothetical protein
MKLQGGPRPRHQQPRNGPHALQAAQSGLVMREAHNEGRIEVTRVQTMEASEESSNETPAQYGNNDNHLGAQKRKRSNNDEGRSTQPYNVSLEITSDGQNCHNIVNPIQDRGQAVSTSPGHNLLTYRILINTNSSCHLTLISITRPRLLLRLRRRQYPRKQ